MMTMHSNQHMKNVSFKETLSVEAFSITFMEVPSSFQEPQWVSWEKE